MTDLFLEPQEASDAENSPSRRSRRQDNGERQRKKRRRRRRWVTAVATVAILGLAGFGIVKFIMPWFDAKDGIVKVQDYPGPGEGIVEVTVASGESGLQIGSALEKAGVVATQKAFYEAYQENPNSTKIQPGTYRLLKEMRAVDAVTGLLNPKNRVANKITIQEGWNTKKIYAQVAATLNVPVADVEAAAKNAQAIHLPAEAKGNPEGWYFPDTYEYNPTDKPVDVLARMVDQMKKVLNEAGIEPKDQLTILTKASLIEKEVNRAEDRPKAARVIENRLKKDWELRLDSTVSYAVGKEELFTSDEDRANKSPYNTYQHKGLPPGPIDSPSFASIQAVLAPADGTWMYWCVVNPNTGETVFSYTQAEQDAALEKLRAYLKANPDWNKK